MRPNRRFQPLRAVAALVAAVGLCGPAAFAQGAGGGKPITIPADIQALMARNNCLSCHGAEQRMMGPPFALVAKKKYTDERIYALIVKPEPANWPDYPPSPALPNVPKADGLKIARWINSLPQ